MINLFQPNIGERELNRLKSVFESNWLGRGKLVTEFEGALANYLKVDRSNIHTLACATDSIFGVFRVLGLANAGGEVIIPSISFPAVASSVLEAGLVPVIVDVEPVSGNISLDSMAKSLSSKTIAIFITHYGGIPVDVGSIRGICPDNILILEDAACAFGTFVDGKACGTIGDFGCWSFDAMKMLTTGEGGACFYADRSLAEKSKEYFYLGLPASEKSGIDRATNSNRWWEYELMVPGRRSVFTNINAAIGIDQFDDLELNFEKRASIRRQYCEVIDYNNNLSYSLQNLSNVIYSNYFFTVFSNERDRLADYLKDNDIYSTFRYHPLHKIDIFKKYAYSHEGADIFSSTALNIPIHHGLSNNEILRICDALDKWNH